MFIILFILLASLIGMIYSFMAIRKNKRRIEIQQKKIYERNEELKESLEEKQFLVHELNHRVKNNLAIILSLINFHKDEEEQDLQKKKYDNLYNRIKMIMLAHELYTYSINNNENNAEINLFDYTNKIFETHFFSSVKPFEYQNDTQEILLKVDKILPLGLILNELITNSLKHAEPPKNKLFISLNIQKINHQIIIHYYDNGCIFKEDKSKETLGIFIIEGMIKQLKGICKRLNSDYKINFPVDE